MPDVLRLERARPRVETSCDPFKLPTYEHADDETHAEITDSRICSAEWIRLPSAVYMRTTQPPLATITHADQLTPCSAGATKLWIAGDGSSVPVVYSIRLR